MACSHSHSHAHSPTAANGAPMEERWLAYMKTVEQRLEPDVARGFHVALKKLTAALRGSKVDDVEALVSAICAPLTADATNDSRTTQQALVMYYVSPATPTRAACEAICEFVPKDGAILEINAHRGVWGRYLQILGRRVDMVHRERKHYESCIAEVRSVESPVSYVQGAGTRYAALLMVRPDTQDGMADAMGCVQAFAGERVIYVGSEPPKDSGERHVWTFLEKHYQFVGWNDLPLWPWCSDHVMLYVRKETPHPPYAEPKK